MKEQRGDNPHVTLLIRIRDVTECCMWDDSFTNELFHICIWSLPEWIMSRTWKELIYNRDMKHSHLGSVFLCSEWSTREKRKHQRIFLIFMLCIWISECPVTRMMGTPSFFLYLTHSIIFPHLFSTHSWMSTHPFFQGTQTEREKERVEQWESARERERERERHTHTHTHTYIATHKRKHTRRQRERKQHSHTERKRDRHRDRQTDR